MTSLKNKVSKEEWQTRVNLAALYRIIGLYGWDDLIFTHITARVPGPEKHFLINGFGTLYEEITASSLVKLDLEGNIILDSGYPINPAGYLIHSVIHRVREDAHCIIHLHTEAGVAVSSLKKGLLPLTQNATLILPHLAYHDYEGIVLKKDEQPRLVKDLGDKTYMLLKNHGTLTIGETIPAAFLGVYYFETACKAQIDISTSGLDAIYLEKDVLDEAERVANSHFGGRLEIKIGELAWPAILRKLDRMDPTYKS